MTDIQGLRRKEPRFPVQGGGHIGIDASGKVTSGSYVTDDGLRLRNPDGPEAADTIDTLLKRIDVLEGLLREVRDWTWGSDLRARIDAALDEGTK